MNCIFWIEDYIPIITSVAAVIVSVAALLFTVKSWKETYRPIVTAKIETMASGSEATLFELLVYNIGNRPALETKIRTDNVNIEELIQKNEEKAFRDEVSGCLSDHGTIPLLQPESFVKNGFGRTNRERSTFKIGTSIPVEITYKDSNGRSYKTEQKLIFRDTTFFAGTGWTKKPNTKGVP